MELCVYIIQKKPHGTVKNYTCTILLFLGLINGSYFMKYIVKRVFGSIRKLYIMTKNRIVHKIRRIEYR